MIMKKTLQPIVYRCPTDQYEDLKRIKRLTRKSINSMLIESTRNLIKENLQSIRDEQKKRNTLFDMTSPSV